MAGLSCKALLFTKDLVCNGVEAGVLDWIGFHSFTTQLNSLLACCLRGDAPPITS